MAATFAKQFGGIFGSSGGGGGGGGTVYQEQPSGTVNGINVTFSLANPPTANANVSLYLDGGIQYQGPALDYTISGATITMAAAPTSPQTLWAVYS